MDTPTPETTLYVVSEQGLAALQNELAELWAIREDEAILDARIARLEEIVARSRVVETGTPGSDVANLGSVVALEDVATGTTSRYRIVAVHDPSPAEGITPVSAASPVGRAIIGQSAGARVSVELPGGRARALRLVRVEADASARGLAAAG